MNRPYYGYHSCPCRDCLETAIGSRDQDEKLPALCHACEDAGCSFKGDAECKAHATPPVPDDHLRRGLQ